VGRADERGGAVDADLRGGDPDALGEVVRRRDALGGRPQLRDHPAGVLGFLGERERAGDLGEDRVALLDDAERCHGGAGRGRQRPTFGLGTEPPLQ
jgi:hypothetical protein